MAKEKIDQIDTILDEIASYQKYTIPEILAHYGYTYEAQRVKELIDTYKQTKNNGLIAAIH